jgi:hypothetical protein
VQTEIDRAVKGLKNKPHVTIGTMIETPRAAIRADEIAEEADFFSFGTNDLTQMTFGFSRDDVESKMMPAYLEQGLLKRNPFETIDVDRRGRARQAGRQRGRSVKKGLKLGVCGEHGGDPESIACSTRPASTTSAAARSACRSPVSPRRRPSSAARRPRRSSFMQVQTRQVQEGPAYGVARLTLAPNEPVASSRGDDGDVGGGHPRSRRPRAAS